ncbi:MAG: TetR/AcrR family transcriptional regulator [Brevinematia bacterium]
MLEKFDNLCELDRKILDEAREEFLKEGFYKASLDRIAFKLKIGKGTIYRHFGNKNILFLSVVVYMLKENWKNISDIKSEKGDFVNTFDKLIDRIFKFHLDTSKFFSSVFTGEIWKQIFKAVKRDRSLKELLDFIIGCRNELETTIAEALEKGRTEGNIKREINTRVVADIILISIEHFFFSYFMEFNKGKKRLKSYQLEDGIKELKAFIFRGICCEN